MKIDYISDIHIDFYLDKNKRKNSEAVRNKIAKLFGDTLKNKEGDILVIAGDVAERIKPLAEVLRYFKKYYSNVLFIFGNHDFRLHDILEELTTNFQSINKVRLLKEELKNDEGIIVLHNEIVEINNIKIAGTPLWYKLTNLRYLINDIDYILYKNVDTIDGWVKESNKQHRKDMSFYKSLFSQNIDVLITHIPPVTIPECPYDYSESFQTKVKEILPVKHWICGHVHTRGEFEEKGVKFHCNPLGYEDEILEKFEIKSFEI